MDRPRTEAGLLPRMALAGLGGVFSFLAFPPVGLWPLAFLAPVPLLLALRDARPRRGLALGLTYGLIGYGLTLYWILLFGELAWVSLTLLAGLSTALFGGVFPIVHRRGRPVLTAFGVASLWTTIDWLRGLWPLGGFTWGSLGISQVSNGAAVRIAVLAGVWGVTFIVVFVACLLADATAARRSMRGRLGSLLLAGLAIFAPVLIPSVRTTGRAIDVAAIQIDFRQAARSPSREAGDVAVTRANMRLHGSLRDRPPDLAIWGESALDPASIEILDEVQTEIAAVGAPVLTGSTSTDLSALSSGGPLFNQAVLFDAEGMIR
nr:hypothetical protein [Actinomycetota bacterium]